MKASEQRKKKAALIRRWRTDKAGERVQLEDYFDLISPDEIRIKGHRINIEQIVERYHNGASPEEIAQDFPGLSLEKIYGVITYYLHNQAEVDDYLKRLDEYVAEQVRLARANPSPMTLRVMALKQQREQGLPT